MRIHMVNSVTPSSLIMFAFIGIPEEEERGKEAEILSEEIIVENFLNLGKETDI